MNLAKGTLGEERAFDFLVLQLLVALENDTAHLHLRLLVDVDVENHLILVRHIVALQNFYLSVLIAFLVEVSLCQGFGAVQDVGRYVAALHNTELRLQVFALRLLQPVIVDGTDARAQSQGDTQVNL